MASKAPKFEPVSDTIMAMFPAQVWINLDSQYRANLLNAASRNSVDPQGNATLYVPVSAWLDWSDHARKSGAVIDRVATVYVFGRPVL